MRYYEPEHNVVPTPFSSILSTTASDPEGYS